MSDKEKCDTIPEGVGYKPDIKFYDRTNFGPTSVQRGSMYAVDAFGTKCGIFIPNGISKDVERALILTRLKQAGVSDEGAAHIADTIVRQQENKGGVGGTQLVGRRGYVDEAAYIHDQKTEKETTPRQMKGDGRRELVKTKSGFTYPQTKPRR